MDCRTSAEAYRYWRNMMDLKDEVDWLDYFCSIHNEVHINQVNPTKSRFCMYAEIIIPLALPKNYTWFVPEHFLQEIKPGCRVEVNLGRNKKYAGIVKRIHNEKPIGFEAKEIMNVLDAEPIIQPFQLQLWKWMAEYYMCTEGEVMAAALPAHFKLSSETVIIYNEEFGDDFSGLDNDEYLVAEALLMKHELRLTEVQQILDSPHVYPVVNRLMGKKVCFVWESLKQTYKSKKDTFVLLNPEYDNEEKLSELLNNWSRAPKQMELLLSYLHLMKTEGEVTKSELLKKSNASDAQYRAKNFFLLKREGIIRNYKKSETNFVMSNNSPHESFKIQVVE
jgi:primosomal protein N' (replication factor Y)